MQIDRVQRGFDKDRLISDQLNLHRIRDIRCRYIEGAHLVRIDPNLDLALAAANDIDVADTADRFDQTLDLFVGDVSDFTQTAWRGYCYAQNRSRVSVEFLHDRNFGSFRQSVDDQIDLVAYFLRGHVRVLL